MSNKGKNKQDMSGFGMRDKEDTLYDIYEREDEGDYVVITHNNNTSAGKISKIVDDVALLNPFQGMDYSKGHPQYILYEGKRHQKVPLKDSKVTPITEKSLKEFINHENAELDKKREEKEEKASRKKKGIVSDD